MCVKVSHYGERVHSPLRIHHPLKRVGEARSALSISQELAARFGFNDPCFSQSETEIIAALMASDSPYLKGITLDSVMEGRPVRLNVPEDLFSGGFKTPSGKIAFYSAAMAAEGLDLLPDGRSSVDTEGHGRFRLQLITPPRHQFL